MDSQGREFESFLQQFRLRERAGFEELIGPRPQAVPSTYTWVIGAAAGLIIMAVLSAMVTLMTRPKTLEQPPAPVPTHVGPVPIEQEKQSTQEPSRQRSVGPTQAVPPREQEKQSPQKEEPSPSPPGRPLDQQQTQTVADHPGKQIFNRACSQCHRTSFMDTYRHSTRDPYVDLVSRERAKGAFVTEEEVPVLVDYLFKTYGVSP